MEEIDYALSFDIIPSHTGVPYYYGVVSEDELEAYRQIAIATDIESVTANENGYDSPSVAGIYTPGGTRLQKVQQGVNIIKYKDGSSKKIFIE